MYHPREQWPRRPVITRPQTADRSCTVQQPYSCFFEGFNGCIEIEERRGGDIPEIEPHLKQFDYEKRTVVQKTEIEEPDWDNGFEVVNV